MRRRSLTPAWALALPLVFAAVVAKAEPFARPTPHAGLIVATKGGEELQPDRDAAWLPAEIRQDLMGGDTLRTNAIGNLALLFADQTQIRVGRNSTLVVKDVVANGPASLALPEGTVWARAARGGASLTIDTPAAAAAIRGTDWTLTVNGDKTALVVLEGAVELANAQGSVLVKGGEAAVATLGQKPTKIILVRPKDREQMLFYLSLRGAFTWLPASPLDNRAMRAARARINAIPEQRRSAEDELTLAETALSFDGRAVATDALTKARKKGLSVTQHARADLIEALIAGAEKRWSDAAGLFRRAEPGLSGPRRTTARYGAAFAQALAEPTKAPTLPTRDAGEDWVGVLGRAWVAGFLQDPKAALAVVREATRRDPGNAMLASAEAQLALLTDDKAVAKEAAARGLAIDPDDPWTIQADAYVRAWTQSQLDEALASLTRAAAIAPGDANVWNAIGLIQDSRNAPREAEAAYRRAIALDPQDPVARANYATMLLDQSRVDLAKAEIDRTLVLDPSFSFGYSALGRYYLQTGETDRAMQNLLAGSVADPTYSQGLLALAMGYYQGGDVDPALQQLDAAARLDPSDPVVPLARTAIALDRFEADRAIESSRDALAKIRARGGYYSPLASARDAGSYLSDSFRLLELNAWGRYYGDAVFDPFAATGYFDQAINLAPAPFFDTDPLTTPITGEEASPLAFSSLLQGLLLDPLAIASRNRRTDLVRRPFLDSEIGGGLVMRGGEAGWTASAEVQGFTNLPVPTSFYLNLAGLDTSGDLANDRQSDITGSFFVGSNPTPYDHVMLFSAANRSEPSLPWLGLGPIVPSEDRTTLSVLGGVGWGHVLGDRSVLTAAAVGSYGRDELDQSYAPAPLDVSSVNDQKVGLVAVGHLYGIGRATLKYGAEGIVADFGAATSIAGIGAVANTVDLEGGRIYADATAPIGDHLQVEAGLHGVFLQGGALDVARLDPRAGIAFEPIQGHWLRAAIRRDTDFPLDFTLSPVATLGLTPSLAPIESGGTTESAILRWEAEWNAHLFTALEYQHQSFDGLSIPIAQTLGTIDLAEGRVDRVTATANVWIGGGFGLFATGSYADGHASDDALGYDGDMPFLPQKFGRAGITWVSPSRIKVTVAQTYVGERLGVRQFSFPLTPRSQMLDAYTTTDIAVTWEPLDRRIAIEASLINAFDNDYRVAPLADAAGRTFLGSMKVRF